MVLKYWIYILIQFESLHQNEAYNSLKRIHHSATYIRDILSWARKLLIILTGLVDDGQSFKCKVAPMKIIQIYIKYSQTVPSCQTISNTFWHFSYLYSHIFGQKMWKNKGITDIKAGNVLKWCEIYHWHEKVRW